MAHQIQGAVTHPRGEQPSVEEPSVIADTFAGRVHIEWDASAPVTPLGQLPFFIDFLKQANLFDPWVADCPLLLTSPNAPRKRDLLGTVMLSVLAGLPSPKRLRAGRSPAVCSCHRAAVRSGEPAAARHAQGSQRGLGTPQP
jgi:hypothetical protein